MKNTNIDAKKEGAWIQFKVSESDFIAIQLLKAQQGKSRTPNKDYYRELLIKGMQAESI